MAKLKQLDWRKELHVEQISNIVINTKCCYAYIKATILRNVSTTNIATINAVKFFKFAYSDETIENTVNLPGIIIITSCHFHRTGDALP